MGKFFCWHKWIYVDGKRPSKFLESVVVDSYREYRHCKKCGKVQQLFWDSQGGGWDTLDKQRVKIFREKKLGEKI